MNRGITRLFGVQRGEAGAVLAGFLMLFFLFTGYAVLRPVRETIGVSSGVENLPWLFTGTFLTTIAVMPAFGWVASRVPRRRIVFSVLILVALTLVAFGVGFAVAPEDISIGRAFYIWLSVFNLIVISAAWSALIDVFSVAQAKRLFGLIAAGASLGGLVGPLLAVFLVERIADAGLLFLSAGLMVIAAFAAHWVQLWRDRHPLMADDDARGERSAPLADQDARRGRPLGGNAFAGALEVLRSPYLLGIAAFVVLLSTASTFLYFEQARLVAQTYPDRAQRTQVFGTLDMVVQALSIGAQLFITGHVARRLGLGVLLVAVPLLVAIGFLTLAFVPLFAVLAIVMVTRRVGEYAFVRPAREMLYAVLSPAAKYKAKNFNDTVVYRGGDAISGWVKTAIDAFAQYPAVAMLIGAALSLVWAVTGALLARAQRRRGEESAGVGGR
jgi:AAA family ATP:ADP antiporter